MKNKNTISIVLLFLVIILLMNCESREWNNPFDPGISPSDWAPKITNMKMIDDAKIELQWTTKAAILDGFIIEKSVKDSIFYDYGITSELYFCDIDINPQYTYQYRIRGFAGDRESENSNEIGIKYVKGGEENWAGYQSGYIFSIGITPDSRVALTGSYEFSLCAWDLLTGDQLWESEHEATIWSIDIHPKGTHAVTASSDNTVAVWSIDNGAQKWLFNGNDVMWSVKYSNDGTIIICGGSNELFLLNAENGKVKWQSVQQGYIQSVDIANNNQYIVSGSNEVQVRKTDSGNILWSGFHSQGVNMVKFTHDASKVISAGKDSRLKIWSTESGNLEWEGSVSGEILSIAISPDNTCVYSGSSDGKVISWDLNTGIQQWSVSIDGIVYSVDCSSDSSLVAAGCENGRVYGINAVYGNILWISGEHTDAVHIVKISNDNLKIMSGGGLNAADLPVRCWWTKNHWTVTKD